MGNCSPSVFRSQRKIDNKETNDQIISALQRKMSDYKAKHGEETISIDRIMLKFEKLRGTCKYIRQLFHSIADKSEEPGLDMEGLTEVMTKLHGQLPQEDIEGLYRFCDLDRSNRIDLKVPAPPFLPLFMSNNPKPASS